ncbi:styrene monooxygenase/indole monooxygenase family protein [Pseudomonas sp. FEN]|uniref:styrene monooxygenase/indole monooxygenase family protein n=1 Tax=Pseudomonas sp. FEN TaxID=2767468 RepID=UPI0017490A6C|nr:styrene monooxygenase/indole monooxygenase family protein [Pseudomonas sp. FEN]CAD5201654.1 putative oxygenase subunit [Pseudomonas sp. FEN]
MSSQGMFDTALQIERRWGLNFWDEECPWNTSVTFTLGKSATARKDVEWKGKMQQPFQSIDQRLKFSRWLDVFQRLEGHLVVQDVTLADLDEISRWHELTVVASGKGEIGQCFPRDHERSTFDAPQRALACLYVTGMLPTEYLPGVRVNVIPNVGEYITMPGLALGGRCEMMLFEGIPGRAFDAFSGEMSVDEQLNLGKALLSRYVPWEAERSGNIKLADGQATLKGRYTPAVKHPVAKMPGGTFVLGMADAVVLNDPIAGQGANSATKCASVYFDRIVERNKDPFDETWMQETFECCWRRYARASTEWSNILLMRSSRQVVELLRSASQLPSLADKLANGFDDANAFFPWIADPIETRGVIDSFK